MTRYWLVRHGPTHAKAMIGWTDLPADLSDTVALARLTSHLPSEAPVVSSDLSRAIATADALGPRPRLAHDSALREIHFGRWEGRGFAEVEAETPSLIRAFWETPGDIRPPGGESWNDLTARTWGALDRLHSQGPDLIVVAHFGPILAALQRAGGLTAIQAFGHRIDNLSVTCLTLDPPKVHTVNHRP
ncbi:histidine phosphatase family protein [Tabrizicola sp.]|uniref:histidine phosphatase family protein n=1 Tax=Tabrizicola sp. TaxID=2005166 RepID=UPI002734FE46|nr:histidine phosphatase family protein [Tabrizicola sp.]MDP3195590.1 histidine phosphatase family protein [Tabrizicola sp.]